MEHIFTKQYDELEKLLKNDKMINDVLERSQQLGLQDYYIGAGCITQTVWNALSGNVSGYGIKDIDFVYFDAGDLSFEAEDQMIHEVKTLFSNLSIKIDVKNQARVHLWYESRFGTIIEPYESLEAAIDTWPTTATAIAVRKEKDRLKIYAPYGLDDMFAKVIRANKVQVTKEIYDRKAMAWLGKWPDLTVVPW